jgi:hypothetical protein
MLLAPRGSCAIAAGRAILLEAMRRTEIATPIIAMV